MIPENQPYVPERIETERLVLRPPKAGDGVVVNAAVRDTFADLHAWMEWADHIPSVEESEQNLLRTIENYRVGKDGMLIAFHKTTGELVLCTGLHLRSRQVPKFEIGYWCRAQYQGQGYVTEAVREITRVGFEVVGANRIEIRCDTRNVRSSQVARRAHYRLEAELRNDAVAPDGQLRNTLVFSMLPEEFRALNQK